MDKFDMSKLSKAAQDDQAMEAQRDFAAIIAAYLTELVKQGLTRDEALALALDYQGAMLDSALHPD